MPNSTKLPTICELLKKLINKNTISDSSIGKTLKKHKTFLSLVGAHAIERKIKCGGSAWEVTKLSVIQKYLTHECPKQDVDEGRGERYNNIHTSRNSKTKNRASYRLIFTRGKSPYTLNNERFQDTSNDTIGKQLNSLKAEKVCFVENLENFMTNIHLIQNDWILIYIIGRIGNSLLDKIEANEILHFSDLDYVGLNEYAKIKKFFPNATLYTPDDYFSNAKKVGTTISSQQKASNALLRLSKSDEKVKEILDFLHTKNSYLEQEGYSDE